MRAFKYLSVLISATRLLRAGASNATSPVVDLGYEVYEGYYNSTSQLNIFKGHVPSELRLCRMILMGSRWLIGHVMRSIRYAAPPTGRLRWRRPQPPAENRCVILSATEYPPRCPQSPSSPLCVNRLFLQPCQRPGSYGAGGEYLLTYGRATNYNFTKTGMGDEDCLFLSVFSPAVSICHPPLLVGCFLFSTYSSDAQPWIILM